MIIYQIALQLLPGIGPVTAKNLLAYTGSAQEALRQPKHKLMKIPGIGDHTADKILANKEALKQAEKEIDFIQKNNINTYFYTDNDYPELLRHCPDAPIMLYAKGKLDVNNKKCISLVGTRRATKQGIERCEQLVKELKETGKDPVIVSGLAFGIDICAHKAAIKFGLPTIAVLGHGLNRIYPSDHEKIAHEIVENGCLITEFLSTSKFISKNFLQRNRIIAGISQATIIVESGEKGGSLVTADIANSYNRDVFAFPGRVNDKSSKGCNTLIKQNKAALIETAKDIEYIGGWERSVKEIMTSNEIFPETTKEEDLILKILKENGKVNIDIICRLAEMETSIVSSFLLALEFKNLVKSLPGKLYEYSWK